MAKRGLSEENRDTVSPTSKRLKVDTPTSTPPTIAEAESTTPSPKSTTTTAEPPKPITTAVEPSKLKKSVIESRPTKEESTTEIIKSITHATEPSKLKKSVTEPAPAKKVPPPKPTSDASTKSEIEKYFGYHFHSTRVFASPEDKKHPGSVPDYHISSSLLVSILSDLSPAALKHFSDEYLDDVYVFIGHLEQIREFASVAVRFPKIAGRIKLDSRKVCDPEREKMPVGLDSEEQQKKLAVKVEKVELWKEGVRKVAVLVGEEMGLDEESFKEKLASITPLTAKVNEPLVEVDKRKWINPVAEDLKVLKYKEGGWSVVISCNSVLAAEEKQTFQLWGDIGGVGGLWKYYETQKEEANMELDVEKVEAGEGSS
ncbi:Vacuolar protein sorting-associated protein 9a [Venturia nashicola]|nr:Vacuolar protein sorting-associated protein 9a [Venturia nashicola]